VLTVDALWGSSRERDEEVLVPRNFGYVGVLVLGKQTRMSCIGWVKVMWKVSEVAVAGCYLGLSLTLVVTLTQERCCLKTFQLCRVWG